MRFGNAKSNIDPYYESRKVPNINFNYNVNEHFEHVKDRYLYKSLSITDMKDIGGVCQRLRIKFSWYNVNNDSIQLYDANGIKKDVELSSIISKTKLMKGAVVSDTSNFTGGHYWLVAKIFDLLENKEDANKLYAAIKYFSKTDEISNYTKMLEFLEETKMKFCIIYDKAYENINHSFQKYLECGTSEWLLLIINRIDWISKVNNEWDLIFDTLSLEQEQLEKIEKKSIFNESVEHLDKSVQMLSKDKGYLAFDALIKKFNRKINGHGIFDSLDNYVEVDESIKKSELAKDDYIIDVVNRFSFGDRYKNSQEISALKVCYIFNISTNKFDDFHYGFGFDICKSIYLCILERLMYGAVYHLALSDDIPDVALYNYFVLGEHKGVLHYAEDPKSKVKELVQKHKEIIDSGNAATDMSITYNVLSEYDMLLIQ